MGTGHGVKRDTPLTTVAGSCQSTSGLLSYELCRVTREYRVNRSLTRTGVMPPQIKEERTQ